MYYGGVKYGQHPKSNQLTRSPHFSSFCSSARFKLVTRLTVILMSVETGSSHLFLRPGPCFHLGTGSW